MSVDRYTCDEVFRRINDYLDRELSAEEMALVRAHLDTCAQCAGEYTFEASALAELKSKLRRIDLPPSVIAKIQALLKKAALVVLLSGGACNWLALAQNSLTYRTVQRGETANVAALGSTVYATLAEDGLAVVDAVAGQTIATLPPARGSESVDDIAIAEGLLFVLDARPPGHLSVYSIADPLRPRLVAPPRPVPVGPFSGVSAARGLCIVSGGTSELTAWTYDTHGSLTGPVATIDLGRGQPDVLVGDRGLIYVSTHYQGPYFGLDIVRYDSASGGLIKLAELPLDDAGFTAGGAKPANFPIEAALFGHDTVLVASAVGLSLIETRVPSHPRLVAAFELGGPAVSVDVAGRVAAVTVAGDAPALVLLDFTSIPLQQRRVPLPVGTFPAGVALGGPRAAVAAGRNGVLFF